MELRQNLTIGIKKVGAKQKGKREAKAKEKYIKGKSANKNI